MRISSVQGLLRPTGASPASPSPAPAAVGAPANHNQDKVSISAFGQKKNARIQSLMKQREALLNRQEELQRQAKDKNSDPAVIRQSLEACEEQIRSIEQQIAQEIRQQSKPEEKAQKAEQPEGKTKEELQRERLEQLTNLSTDISRAQTLQSAQKRVEGMAKVRKSELALDRGSSEKTLAHKKEEIADLEQRAASLTSQAMEKLADTSKEAQDTLNALPTPKEEDKEPHQQEEVL